MRESQARGKQESQRGGLGSARPCLREKDVPRAAPQGGRSRGPRALRLALADLAQPVLDVILVSLLILSSMIWTQLWSCLAGVTSAGNRPTLPPVSALPGSSLCRGVPFLPGWWRSVLGSPGVGEPWCGAPWYMAAQVWGTLVWRHLGVGAPRCG